jgi:two-component system response regulator HydG
MDTRLSGRILVVDDDENDCELLKLALSRLGVEVVALTSASEALDRVANEEFDVVLTDVGMEEMGGLELCRRILGTRPDVVVVVVTGQSSLETAVAALRSGAFDFLSKPLDAKLLGVSLARALQHRQLLDELKRLRTVEPAASRGELIGESAAMRRVYDLIERIGASEPSVLVSGESGTGKELVARAIHDASERASGPFVALNCAAVPPALIESELFGHAKGAFTDAKAPRAGLFARARGGTLFLDEIGDMPLDMQPKLLRALQERRVRPVGADEEVDFDARLIAATNRDLDTEVHEKRFREDLYYRINVVSIELPPLRERGQDILLLARHFLAKHQSQSERPPLALSPPVAEKLLSYDWPGNVRELENSIERMVALARFDQLTVEDLPEKIRQYQPDRFLLAADHAEEILPLDEVERRYIRRVLKLVDGNKTRAAKLLGIDRRTLYRKAEEEASEEQSG